MPCLQMDTGTNSSAARQQRPRRDRDPPREARHDRLVGLRGSVRGRPNLVDNRCHSPTKTKVQRRSRPSLTYQHAVRREDTFAISSVLELGRAIGGSAVGFLVWWYRAYANLPGPPGRRFGSAGAGPIGAGLRPILSLWRQTDRERHLAGRGPGGSGKLRLDLSDGQSAGALVVGPFLQRLPGRLRRGSCSASDPC